MPPSRRRRPNILRPRLLIPIAIFLVIGAVAAYLLASGNYRKAGHAFIGGLDSRKTPAPAHAVRSPLENTIRECLHRLEIPDSAVAFKFFPAESLLEIHAAVPMGEPMAVILHRLSEAAAGTSYHIDDCFCPPDGKPCDIRYVSSIPGQPVVVMTVSRAPRFLSTAAKIAIVITDIGSVPDDIGNELLSLPAALTIALPPTQAATAQAKRIAGDAKKEVLLLLPLESSKKSRDDFRKLRLMIHYPDDKLRSLIHGSMSMVPHCAGIGNLGGSRALEDSRVMTIVFSEMKRRHAYFLERVNTRKSVAASLAEQMEIPYAAVEGVIDSSDEPVARAAIRTVPRSMVRGLPPRDAQELLVNFALEARKRGKMIIEAKASGELLRALRHELPAFERSGIKVSFVSRLFDTTGVNR